MAYQHQRFHTNGSNALKVEDLEFDIFVKPQFLAGRDRASIIDFEDVRKEHTQTKKNFTGTVLPSRRSRNSVAQGTKKDIRIMDRIRSNRILGDLFATNKKNTYRRDDLIVFAKGFSITGAATFILILFGV